MEDKIPLGDQFPVIEGEAMGIGEEKLRHNMSASQLRVRKPWGSYTDFYRTDNVVFKTISVTPNSRLSLQSHNGRNEFWVVVSGECVCQLDDAEFKMTEGDVILIPKTSVHRLCNRSSTMCVVAELQYGACNEDDIIRYEDDYKRE